MVFCIFSLVTDFIIFCCKICLNQDKSGVSQLQIYYHYYIFKLLPSLFLPSFVVSLWRCFMMCGGSWRRIGTPSEMTFCSSSKTAGEHVLICILYTGCNAISSPERVSFTAGRLLLLLQARLHLWPLWTSWQQKWRRDSEDGDSSSETHRQLSVQGETAR